MMSLNDHQNSLFNRVSKRPKELFSLIENSERASTTNGLAAEVRKNWKNLGVQEAFPSYPESRTRHAPSAATINNFLKARRKTHDAIIVAYAICRHCRLAEEQLLQLVEEPVDQGLVEKNDMGLSIETDINLKIKADLQLASQSLKEGKHDRARKILLHLKNSEDPIVRSHALFEASKFVDHPMKRFEIVSKILKTLMELAEGMKTPTQLQDICILYDRLMSDHNLISLYFTNSILSIKNETEVRSEAKDLILHLRDVIIKITDRQIIESKKGQQSSDSFHPLLSLWLQKVRILRSGLRVTGGKARRNALITMHTILNEDIQKHHEQFAPEYDLDSHEHYHFEHALSAWNSMKNRNTPFFPKTAMNAAVSFNKHQRALNFILKMLYLCPHIPLAKLQLAKILHMRRSYLDAWDALLDYERMERNSFRFLDNTSLFFNVAISIYYQDNSQTSYLEQAYKHIRKAWEAGMHSSRIALSLLHLKVLLFNEMDTYHCIQETLTSFQEDHSSADRDIKEYLNPWKKDPIASVLYHSIDSPDLWHRVGTLFFDQRKAHDFTCLLLAESAYQQADRTGGDKCIINSNISRCHYEWGKGGSRESMDIAYKHAELALSEARHHHVHWLLEALKPFQLPRIMDYFDALKDLKRS